MTSIMTSDDGPSNVDEIVDILRWCRTRNIIFDCDSVLKQGRGSSCGLATEDVELRAALLRLQAVDHAEFGVDWEVSQSYVGTVCDRYAHHMYISQFGTIRPCIGAVGINLGNARKARLSEAWGGSTMQVVRGRKFGGDCAKCANFTENKCNSCLGRRCPSLNKIEVVRLGEIDTTGCWNRRPISDSK